MKYSLCPRTQIAVHYVTNDTHVVSKTPWIYFTYKMTLCQEIWTVKETQKRQNRGTHLTGIKKLTQA